MNGILTGYDLQYSVDQSPRSWSTLSSKPMVRQITITGLNEYTDYVVKVAGKTSVGTGVYSAEESDKTHEDSEYSNH